ncbi:hypothetical protein A9Q98_02735 [Thalassotalea sp. 42_200_T64]|nr:hypothetical protein A9Q98_02735 [Thalassotalea sp. 42_200_T64]
MSLFSWFSRNEQTDETTLSLTNKQQGNGLTLNAKSMWPIAKVRYLPSTLVDSNTDKETDLIK